MDEGNSGSPHEREIAFSSLFILTCWNILLGVAIVVGIIPVGYGMMLALGGMLCIIVASWKVLMKDELPWQSPKNCSERKDNE